MYGLFCARVRLASATVLTHGIFCSFTEGATAAPTELTSSERRKWTLSRSTSALILVSPVSGRPVLSSNSSSILRPATVFFSSSNACTIASRSGPPCAETGPAKGNITPIFIESSLHARCGREQNVVSAKTAAAKMGDKRIAFPPDFSGMLKHFKKGKQGNRANRAEAARRMRLWGLLLVERRIGQHHRRLDLPFGDVPI